MGGMHHVERLLLMIHWLFNGFLPEVELGSPAWGCNEYAGKGALISWKYRGRSELVVNPARVAALIQVLRLPNNQP